MALMNKQQLVSEVSAGITCGCGAVGNSITPCRGVRSLNNAASTSTDRQDECRCPKTLAGSIKQLNMGAVFGIPSKCRVPFPLNLSTDCNNAP